MLKIIEATGDYFTCGKTFGTSCIKNIANRLKRELANNSTEIYKNELKEIDTLCKKFYPEYIIELKGIAEGAKVDYWKLLLLNSPELMERHQGCTSIAISNKKEFYLVHNEDGNSNEDIENCIILHYTLPHCSFYAFTYAGELPGASYGWNSHGLYFSVNYLKPINNNINEKISRNFIARKMLELNNIDNVKKIIKNGQDMSGYHYYMGQGNKLISIENFQDEISLNKVIGINIHTNHYLHRKFTKRANGKENSLIRQNQAEKLIKKGFQPLKILADRANLPNAICTKFGEGLHTISTVGFYPQKKKW